MYNLQCSACTTTYPGQDGHYQCPQCGSALEVTYDYRSRGKDLTRDGFAAGAKGLWKYRGILPVGVGADVVTLGEGGTPLHKCNHIAHAMGLVDQLYVKDEAGNPTGTYKDRPASVSVTVAKALGAKTVAIASDGNAAPSVAAYAAKAGLECFAFMPESTPIERLVLVQMYGAPIITIQGSVNECIDLAERGRELFGWHHMSTAGPINPYQREGTKTIAYEICEQLDWVVPKWVVIPVGGGGLLVAVWKGFVELKALGRVDRLPRVLAVQASGCAPLVRAFETKDSTDEIRRWENPKTVATTIGVPYPLDGAKALQAIRESGGVAITVDDSEILAMTRELSSREGILLEPTGAVSMTAVKKARAMGLIDGTVVSIATGTGLKTLSLFASLWGIGGRMDTLQSSILSTSIENNRKKLKMESEVLAWAQGINASATISSSYMS